MNVYEQGLKDFWKPLIGKAKIEAVKELGKLLIDKWGEISYPFDIVDVVVEEIERLEKEYEEG